MQKSTWIASVAVPVVTVILVWQPGNFERDLRRLIQDVQTAALNRINRRNPNALDIYFAAVAEGAQETELTETQEAYTNFVGEMSVESVQLHSFQIEDVEVHEDIGLAWGTKRRDRDDCAMKRYPPLGE